jgi:hypothetical protein
VSAATGAAAAHDPGHEAAAALVQAEPVDVASRPAWRVLQCTAVMLSSLGLQKLEQVAVQHETHTRPGTSHQAHDTDSLWQILGSSACYRVF